MATSGTISTTTFNTRKVIDRAFGRCKLKPELITAEKIEIAYDNLYTGLSNLANRGVQLWCIEKLIIPLYQGVEAIELPLGTIDVLNGNVRTLDRLTGTDTSSDGGTVANGFDDDFATKVTQTAPNGNIQTIFSSDTQVTSIGILPGTTATWTLTIERSEDDGATWTTVYAPGSADYTDNEWVWYDLDGSIATTYWRLRVSGGGTLSLRELYWGNNPNEIPLGRLNQDSYTALPNKTFQGKPLQYWFDRQLNQPIMHIWPVTNEGFRYAQFTIWRHRYIQDVGTMAQEVEVPQRWYRAIVAQLAADIASELPEVNDAREGLLFSAASVAWTEAQNEERDNSPLMITPSISGYTI